MTDQVGTSANQNSTNQPPADASKRSSADADSSNLETAVTPPDAAGNQAENANEVERLTLEVSETRDRYLRAVAEMDNMRKRLEREKQEFLRFSCEPILKDMIPVLDSLEKALPGEGHPESGAAAYLEGVAMVKRQLLQTLAKHGLEPVEAVGKGFDPNYHQAIQQIESETVTVETVATEFAKGYSLHGRLIRPSMVSVWVPKGAGA